MAFGTTLATRRREIRYTVFVVLLLTQFLLGLAASTVPVPPEEAAQIQEILPADPSITDVFNNNIRVAALDYVPGLGIAWMGFMTWNSGLVFSALAPTGGLMLPGPLAWIVVSGLPFFWLEFMSYSLAATAGTMMLLALVFDRSHFGHEVSRTLLTTPVYLTMLWNGAVNELARPPVLIVLGWIPLVTIGLVLVLIYSNWYGPRLTSRDWSVMIGSLVVFVIMPAAYVSSFCSTWCTSSGGAFR